MQTLTIKFTRDFYNPLSKKIHKAGSLLDVAVDSENFPIHSFWQSIFKDNNGDSICFEIVSPEITSIKPKKAN